METTWVVRLCTPCGRAYGKSSRSKDIRCLHCNHSENEIISRHNKPEDAQKAVTLHNTPPEIRDELQQWMDKSAELDFRPSRTRNVDGERVLSLAADNEGIVTLESVQMVLDQMRSKITSENFLDAANAAGELLFIEPGVWRLL
ncbi:MAG: hypothetical protein QF440_06770 [Candidatus Thalassarchaeaceae archaeon]|jgi:hypothetical protein|nr:hypothetical protein [Candidatus Thalassarchaeaceae archaeon]